MRGSAIRGGDGRLPRIADGRNPSERLAILNLSRHAKRYPAASTTSNKDAHMTMRLATGASVAVSVGDGTHIYDALGPKAETLLQSERRSTRRLDRCSFRSGRTRAARSPLCRGHGRRPRHHNRLFTIACTLPGSTSRAFETHRSTRRRQYGCADVTRDLAPL